MNISYKKKSKEVIPNLQVTDDDIVFGVELKATMQSEGWKVFEKLYKAMEDEIQSSALAAVMLKENDREIALKTAVLLGLKTCFGLAGKYVEDVEDLVEDNSKRVREEQSDASHDGYE